MSTLPKLMPDSLVDLFESYKQLVKEQAVFDTDNNANIKKLKDVSTISYNLKESIERISVFANHPFLIHHLPGFIVELHKYLDNLYDESNTLDAKLEDTVKKLKQIALITGTIFQHEPGNVSPAKTRKVSDYYQDEEEEEEVPPPKASITVQEQPKKDVIPPSTPKEQVESITTTVTQPITQEEEEEEEKSLVVDDAPIPKIIETKQDEIHPEENNIPVPQKLVVDVVYVAPRVEEIPAADHHIINFDEHHDDDDTFVNHTGDPTLEFIRKSQNHGKNPSSYDTMVTSTTTVNSSKNNNIPQQEYSHHLNPSSTFNSLVGDNTDRQIETWSLTTFDHMEQIEKSAVENEDEDHFRELEQHYGDHDDDGRAILENNNSLEAPPEILAGTTTKVQTFKRLMQLQDSRQKRKYVSNTRKPNPDRVNPKRIKSPEEEKPHVKSSSSSSSSSLVRNHIPKKTIPPPAIVVPAVTSTIPNIHSAYVFRMEITEDGADKNEWTTKARKNLDDCIISYVKSPQYKIDVGKKDENINIANEKLNAYGEWTKAHSGKKKKARPVSTLITPSLLNGKTAPQILSLFWDDEYLDS